MVSRRLLYNRFFYMCYGFLLWREKNFTYPEIKSLYSIPSFVVFCLLIKIWNKCFRINWLLENLLGLLSICALILIVLSLIHIKLWTVFAFIGSISYMLYLTEMRLIAKPIKYLDSHYAVYDHLWLVSVIVTLIVICISYALTRLYDNLSGKLINPAYSHKESSLKQKK